MLAYVFCVFSITIIGLTAAELNIPLKICIRNSEDHSICLKQAVKELFLLLLPGLPEIGFPPLDPFVFEHESIEVISNLVRGTLTVMNFSVSHLSMLDFCDVRAHYQDNVFGINMCALTPKMTLEGRTKLDGVIGVFRIAAEGYMNLIMEDVRGTSDIVGHVVNDTWIIEHINPTLSIVKFKLYYEDLLEDNKQFYDLVVSFVNEYWPVIYRAVWPFIRDTADSWFSDFLNKNIFSKLSFSKTFP